MSTPEETPASKEKEAAKDGASGDEQSRLGKFIQTYSSFLSTFVVGMSGLIATSIWQYKQSDISRRQAESQQKIAQMQAENNWRIERAEILSKNLQVLASSGEPNIEQRYGVLLSLTRGNILDAELAVSYALELGKDSPEYMKSVLANTADKSYQRLMGAFELTCQQRFGVARDVPICKHDKLAERSAAIAELVSDEMEQARTQSKPGPTVLLTDEYAVQSSPARLAFLFSPYLTQLYERRQWNEVTKFEALSAGAHLISSLVLGPSRPHEFVAESEAAEVEKFHDAEVKWLFQYLVGGTCNGDCKSKIVDVMLTLYTESNGKFDEALRSLLQRSRADIAAVLSRLHTRLLACQMDAVDLAALRDRVFIPVLAEELKRPKPEPARIDDLLGLLALLPPQPPAKAADKAALAKPAPLKETDKGTAADKAVSPVSPAAPPTFASLQPQLKAINERFLTTYAKRRDSAMQARNSPTPMLKKALFCRANDVSDTALDMGEE